MSQPSQDAVLEDFWYWENTSRVEVVADLATDEKAYFIPSNTLRICLESDGGQTITQILSTLFKSDDLPIHPELILQGHTAVFCILLGIGKGGLIEQFACYEELSDKRLPFNEHHPPLYFPVTDDPTLLQKFCKRQWMYCVPVLDSHMVHKHFGSQRLLPITEKEQRGNSRISTLYKVKLYGPYNKLLPIRSDMVNDIASNTFILKQYSKEYSGQYIQEINAFRSLKSPESIVQFYGSFIHGDQSTIILEYANLGSLEEYFQRQLPPSRGVEIIKFWASILKLLDALKAIHSVLGSHHNIKPSKVLVMSHGESPSDLKIKLADFGQNLVKTRVQGESAAMSKCGSNTTYGAPECCRPFNLHDSQASDIWSLGCIYSETAVWMADGYQGVVDYRKQRMDETSQILNFQGSDCFHDGERVLNVVLGTHAEIEESLRRSDYITKDVLDSMVDEMLWDEDRPKLSALIRKAEGLLPRARQKLPSSSGDETPRAPSRFALPPLQQPPTWPLPSIPQRAVAKASVSHGDQRYAPHADKWQSQVTVPQIGSPQFRSPTSEVTSPVQRKEENSDCQSLSDTGREINGSLASWQTKENSLPASSITPFTTPLPSAVNHYNKHLSIEGRALPLLNRGINQISPTQQKPMTSSQDSPLLGSVRRFVNPTIADTVPELTEEIYKTSLTTSPSICLSTIDGSKTLVEDASTIDQNSVHFSSAYSIPVSDLFPQDEGYPYHASLLNSRSARDDWNNFTEETRTGDQNNVLSSDAYSIPVSDLIPRNGNLSYPISPEEIQNLPNSQKHREFSLFPHSTTKGGYSPTLNSDTSPAPSKASIKSYTTLPMSRQEIVQIPPVPPLSVKTRRNSTLKDYTLLDAILEWKKAQQKLKKWEKSPLPGTYFLPELKDRDHAFIIDDASSMKDCWMDVQRLFEGLSYVVKGMSPEGIELFYTISSNTWPCKDTSDPCELLEKKSVGGETDISYRLNLQLQSYRDKISAAKSSRSKRKKLRPLSFYILTNGEWAGEDPRAVIRNMADFLAAQGSKVKKCMVSIQFISFAQTPAAVQRMSDLADENYGNVDIVDCTPWNGNVLKMLRGPLDSRANPTKVDADAKKMLDYLRLGASRRNFSHAPFGSTYGAPYYFPPFIGI